MENANFKQTATRELALFVGLLFVGLVIMPVAIYQVGQLVFGAYGGVGYGDFFARLSERIRHFDLSAWILVLSPWIGWQILRLSGAAWRLTRR